MMIASHMVWGWVLGWSCSRYVTRTRLNLPLIMIAGGLPDFDLLTRQPVGSLFGHHGVSHAWLAILLAFAPFLVRYRAQTIPYLVGVLQHPLFGDLVTNEVPLIFPVSLEQWGLNLYRINENLSLGLEVLGLSLFLLITMKERNLDKIVRPEKLGLVLILPLPLLFYAVWLSVTYLGTQLWLYAGYGLILNSLVIILSLLGSISAGRRFLSL